MPTEIEGSSSLLQETRDAPTSEHPQSSTERTSEVVSEYTTLQPDQMKVISVSQPPEAEEKEPEHASFFTAVISLVNSTLGSGMLGIPLAYSKAGLIPAIILHILMGVMSWASFYFLTYSSEATGVYSYGDLGYRTFGYYGTLVNEICTFIYTFGPLWSYCIMMGDFLPSVLHGAGVPDKWYTGRVFIIIILAFFIVQPLSWLRSLNSLRFTSFVGMSAMMFCVLVIVIRFGAHGPTGHHELLEGEPFPSHGSISKVEAVHASPSMISTFSTLCFAFGCQQNVPLIHAEIYEKSTKKMNYIAVWSVLIVGIFYMIAGIFGYMTWTDLFDRYDNSGNVLNMYDDRDWLVFVARIGSLFTVIFCCPMNSLPARVAVYNIFDASVALYKEHKARKQVAMSDVEAPSPQADPSASSTSTEQQTSEGTSAPSQESATDRTDAPAQQERSQVQNTAGPQFIQIRPSWWHKKILCLTGEIWVSCIIGTVMVVLAVILAIFLSKLEFVFDFLGSTAGVAVAFMIPAAVYIRVIRHPEKYVDPNRDPNTKRPEGLKEFEERNKKMMTPAVGCTPGIFFAWLVFWLGAVLGLFALTVAIISDTGLKDKVSGF